MPKEEPREWIKIPRSLPRRAVSLVPWLWILADENGVVPCSLLSRQTGLNHSNTTRAVAELVKGGVVVRLTRRMAAALDLDPARSWLRVVWSRIFGNAWKACLNCPRPVHPARGARYCPTCQATVSRPDRTWKAIAFERWHQGKDRRDEKGRPLPESEAQIVYAIHAATRHPLFTRARQVGDEEAQEGIVDYLVRMGMIDEANWKMRGRAFRSGDEGSDDV